MSCGGGLGVLGLVVLVLGTLHVLGRLLIADVLGLSGVLRLLSLVRALVGLSRLLFLLTFTGLGACGPDLFTAAGQLVADGVDPRSHRGDRGSLPGIHQVPAQLLDLRVREKTWQTGTPLLEQAFAFFPNLVVQKGRSE